MFKLIFMVFLLNAEDPRGPYERAEVFDTFTDCMVEAVNFAMEADRREGIKAIAVSCVRVGDEEPIEGL
jgi:hypothetical protein